MLLLWEWERIGVAVGMCGWLPFAEGLLEPVDGNRRSWQMGKMQVIYHLQQTDEVDNDFDQFFRDDDCKLNKIGTGV